MLGRDDMGEQIERMWRRIDCFSKARLDASVGPSEMFEQLPERSIHCEKKPRQTSQIKLEMCYIGGAYMGAPSAEAGRSAAIMGTVFHR